MKNIKVVGWEQFEPNWFYRSNNHNIGSDFYEKSLRCAKKYCRAVGFFSSSGFETASSAFINFFSSGNVMFLICSPWLSRRDAERLEETIQRRSTVLSMYHSIEDWRTRFIPDRHGWNSVLPWLVAQGLVQIRFALVGRETEGVIYHEKIGYFKDISGKIVAYQGSANESARGLRENFERIDVYADWWGESDRRRARQLELHFDQLWANKTSGLKVMTLLEAYKNKLIFIRNEAKDFENNFLNLPTKQRWLEGDIMNEVMIPPTDRTLFPHQEEAISAWGQAGGRGILEMATGSGKTFTALMAASRIYDKLEGKGLTVIVVAPFLHLVDQWIQETRRFGLEPTRCAENRTQWEEELSSAIFAINHNFRSILSIVITQKTFCSELFSEIINRVRGHILIIADEVHNYGTKNTLRFLPSKAFLRLGLSATPERWLDSDGTEGINSYFGKVVYRYSLKNALEDQILTPYFYYPVLVDLAEEELELYMELTRLLTRYMHQDSIPEGDSPAMKVLIKRARLLASARNKLPALKQILKKIAKSNHILIYCGDGQVEQEEQEETQRQVEAVIKMLNGELGMTAALYTAETTSKDRQLLLERFTQGSIQVLVAIRCLDEGVDIPSIHTAFLLASSTNPRQFIQRRGRLLRRSPGKKNSIIYDFFVAPPLKELEGKDNYLKVVRNLFLRQLERAAEFTELASNGPQARQVLREVSDSLNLAGLW
jgi:DNA phosphorothioation system restriction enzyme